MSLTSPMSPLHGFLFLVFSIDVYMHAPIKIQYAKEIALVLSVIATLLRLPLLVILSEITWIVLLCSIEELPKEKKPEEEELVGKPVKPPLHESLKLKAKKSYDILIKNLNTDTNADGKAWILEAEDKKYRTKIWSSEYVGKSIKRWKTEVILENITLPKFIEEVMNFDKRCGGATGKLHGGGWDNAIQAGKILYTFDDDIHSISVASTHPVGGGAISSREFLDLRAFFTNANSNLAPDGGFVLTMLSLEDADKNQLPRVPRQKKGLIRGYNYPGGGARVSPVAGEPNTFRFEAVSNMELNGWIPTAIINTATCSAMMDSNKAMINHLRSLHVA